MLTLFHAPHSRSTRIVQLAIELDIMNQLEIRTVTVARQDGSGSIDPDNPHAEGKVPMLLHDGCEIRESNAIILYLTDLFPSSLAPTVGAADRGSYLSWLAYYGNVVEPVLVHHFAELSHPALHATFRGIPELTRTLSETLDKRDYLLGDSFTAADLLLASPFSWFTELVPDVPSIQSWLTRCQTRPSVAGTAAFDEKHASVV